MAVASLAYVVFETVNPDRWDGFLQKTTGLARASGPGEGHYYRMDERAWRVNIRPGKTERFAAAGLEFAKNMLLEACVKRLEDAGAKAVEDRALARERDGVHIASQFGRRSNDRMMSVYAVTPGNSMLEFGCAGLKIDWRNGVPTMSLVPDLWGHKLMGGPKDAAAL